MKLFDKAIAERMANLTDEQLDELEAQGCDVSTYRAERAAKKQEEEERQQNFKNPTNLEKLKPYTQTPRDMNTPFFKAVAGKEPWLFKKSWEKKYTQSPLIFAAIVQANSDLWMPGDNSYYPVVCVFALDEKTMHNTERLREMADQIYAMKDLTKIPIDCLRMIETLKDDQSEFCFKVGKSVSGDADVWCATYKFPNQKKLPRKALPSDRIVPFLLLSAPIENRFVDFKEIPADLYID